jgi:hypothetical protein
MNRFAGIMLKVQDVLGVGVTRATRGAGPLALREEALAPFRSLTVDLPATVRVIKGDQHQVRVRTQANLLPCLVATVRAGHLHLDLRGSVWAHQPPEVEVVCPDPLDTVKVNGPGQIHLEHLAPRAILICRGPGHVHGQGDFSLLKVSLSGACGLTLKGRAEVLCMDQSGVGDADLSAMTIRHATVNAKGVGKVVMQVSDALRAEVDGLTHIKVRGNPVRRQVNCTNLGKVSFG